MAKQEHILIIGAGLCGSLLALRMAQRGYKITLMEKRPDLRAVHQDAGRSINLALSDRGLKGIRLVGLEDRVKDLCIPMNGRMLHDKESNTLFSPYSGRTDEYINSISRTDLNIMLLNAADEYDTLQVHFNQACTNVDLKNATATFTDYHTKEEQTITADIILGADGAGSAVRKSMYMSRDFLFSFSQDYLGHGYKELTFPPAENGGYRTEKNALHIWPRGRDMIIALPNLDGSFTVTLFIDYKDAPDSFASLDSPAAITEFFTRQFPDAIPMMPELVKEYEENPVGPLGTIKCHPWSAFGKTCILGDAAHAIVPFYGQGMNASFEDVVVFDEMLDAFSDQGWEKVFKEFEKTRKPDTDAIANLAVDNFHEMKEHTAHPMFQEKRKLETQFEKEFPTEYYSKYSLVTFNEAIGYKEAMTRGRAQNKAILNLLDDGLLPDSLSLKAKLKKVQQATEDILHDDAIAGNI
ncbi:FAD-dependent oxidoreductase [Dokdonia donghaensis]|uniref:Kynurenine 3-monooxygenase n=1 Tax=Dokdonia donghaensis DSW-1 TaxID=1300343 RepID=A0A0A2GWG7_9FLAO|nr:NAD(P)/FAD-dependent oxidoreductase [Dokdonia donghaensis]ANH60294.1 Kynurenine 3-monooxygenase [Dokdonia donghaensis DSW-1]KGO07577.1 kynurenine 3-monooxygenase [Dokdonia donghaensis DSW-1]